MPFTTIASIIPRQLFGGAIQGRYAHTDGMTLGAVELAPDTDVPMHTHPHEQITYVLEGEFDFTVGSETQLLVPGSVALIPGGVPHGGRTRTFCRVVDVFAPARDDYR
jgi:quercetin dioxygenase-like cupin family protein